MKIMHNGISYALRPVGFTEEPHYRVGDTITHQRNELLAVWNVRLECAIVIISENTLFGVVSVSLGTGTGYSCDYPSNVQAVLSLLRTQYLLTTIL